MIRLPLFMLFGVMSLFASANAKGQTAPSGKLVAGAARVDITPDAQALPRPFTSILDAIYTRAIYLEDDGKRALLLNADIGAISTAVTDKTAGEISRELDIPVENILISATHDHNAIFGGLMAPGQAPATPAEKASAEFETKFEQGMIRAAKMAHDRARPARIGFGTGSLHLNVNRDAIDEKTRLWSQEPNLEYPSDKTLAVIKIESLDGKLIAVYVNYAMHANMLFLDGRISGDFPGEAERYLERTYAGDTVAVWTSGAAGDQNPLYLRAQNKVADARIRAIMDVEHLELGPAIMRAMFVGDPKADNVPLDAVALEQSISLVRSDGQLTAEEAIRVMDNIWSTASSVRIEGAQSEVVCPARRRLDNGREGAPGRYEDSADPVRIKIGGLRIGDTVLGTANAELYNMIGQRAKAGSKFRQTMIVTLTNGMANSGYVPTDDAFGRYTFQVLGSSLKPGCAENGIVNGIDDIFKAFQ